MRAVTRRLFALHFERRQQGAAHDPRSPKRWSAWRLMERIEKRCRPFASRWPTSHPNRWTECGPRRGIPLAFAARRTWARAEGCPLRGRRSGRRVHGTEHDSRCADLHQRSARHVPPDDLSRWQRDASPGRADDRRRSPATWTFRRSPRCRRAAVRRRSPGVGLGALSCCLCATVSTAR